MRRFIDPVLGVLLFLLLASLLAFFLDRIPYPYGLFVLGAFVAARILYLAGRRPGGN